MSSKKDKDKDDKYTISIVSVEDGTMPRLLYRLLSHASPSGEEKKVAEIIKRAILNFDKAHVINEDKLGNIWIEIGERGKDHATLFSAHMDTMHRKEEIIHLGISKPNYHKGEGYLFAFTKGFNKGNYIPEILGADDKLGVYALLQLIKNKVPGLYIFHVSEERGGVGSRHIADNNPKLVEGIKRAIAFDRRGTTDVISEQRGSNCCSITFGNELAAQLNKSMPPKNQYKSDVAGSFTDTASYMRLIPECTNISCGYYNEHSSNEHCDLFWYVDSFLPSILKVEWEKLSTVRDPLATPSYASRVSWANRGSYSTISWDLTLENILKCDGVVDLEDKISKWVHGGAGAVYLNDYQKGVQLKAFVKEVLRKLKADDILKNIKDPQEEQEDEESVIVVNKALLNQYSKLMNSYVTALTMDIAADEKTNNVDADKLQAIYQTLETIDYFIKEYDEDKEGKPKADEIVSACINFFLVCVKFAGGVKSKSSSLIDAVSDIIDALVEVRTEPFIKHTTYRKTVKLPAMVKNGSYTAMPVPCKKKCAQNGVYGMCTGCHRTVIEKTRWYAATVETQKDIWSSVILRSLAFPEIVVKDESSHVVH